MITPATLKNIPELIELVNSGYRGESSKKGWTTEADLLDGIRTDEGSLTEMINKPGAVILIAQDENNLLTGCVYLEKQDDALYLGLLTVSPMLQGAGLGKQLLRAGETYAKQAGCVKVVMTVISIRTELIAWYQRHGYIDTGRKKPFPMDDPKFGLAKQFLEFIVMEKRVD